MRLADFILSNVEPILVEWEVFARSIWPEAAEADRAALRDHASDILRATAADMKSSQSVDEQADKSKGDGGAGAHSARIDRASDVHAVGRVRSGFDLLKLVAEYRALRASVIRLWRASCPVPDPLDVDDLTRFNESIDQSLTEALRSYTERVEQSRQMFLAILGHDLRNPLSAMMMSAQVLERAGKLEPDLKRIASRISVVGQGMARMINDLLDFTSTRLGKPMPVSPAPMDLGKLCRSVVEEVRATHPNRNILFESQGELAGRWDEARLRQVVANLLGNAVQHGAIDQPVKLNVSSGRTDVLIEVRNAGPPIPSGAMATIFDPLVRAASAEPEGQRRQGSIGLGLYIVREVVHAHGGAVAVKSSADEGTVFTARLPRRG